MNFVALFILHASRREFHVCAKKNKQTFFSLPDTYWLGTYLPFNSIDRLRYSQFNISSHIYFIHKIFQTLFQIPSESFRKLKENIEFDQIIFERGTSWWDLRKKWWASEMRDRREEKKNLSNYCGKFPI